MYKEIYMYVLGALVVAGFFGIVISTITVVWFVAFYKIIFG